MATHSSVLAWRIPGTGEPGGCRLWGRTESDTTEVAQQQQALCPLVLHGPSEEAERHPRVQGCVSEMMQAARVSRVDAWRCVVSSAGTLGSEHTVVQLSGAFVV